MNNRISNHSISRRLDALEKSPNYLTTVLKGHHSIDLLIDRAIENYVHGTSMNLDRLSFALKLDLTGMLGIISPKSMPLFRIFNKIRNRFAHNPFARFTSKDAQDMANCLSDIQRSVIQGFHVETPINKLPNRRLLRLCITTLVAELIVQIETKLREDISMSITMKKVKEVADRYPKIKADVERDDEFKKQVDEEVRKIFSL